MAEWPWTGMKHFFTFRDNNIISNRVGCSVLLLAYSRNKCCLQQK